MQHYTTAVTIIRDLENDQADIIMLIDKLHNQHQKKTDELNNINEKLDLWYSVKKNMTVQINNLKNNK
jgi:hypothetical protein